MSYVLHVKIVEAADIARMDGIFGKSDPYIIVQLGNSQKRKTSVKKNTQRPVWNEQFDFNVTDMNGFLMFLMRDEDVAIDDDMARLQINLNSIKFGQVIDQWYPMTPVKGVKKGGQLHLILHLADLRDPPFVNRPMQQGGYYAPPPGAPGFYAPPPAGYYPPQGAPGMYPPQGAPGMYPPQGAPGMYPPQPQPGMYPAQPQPGMYPPQGAPGMYPPQPGMYAPQQPGMYPPQPGYYPR